MSRRSQEAERAWAQRTAQLSQVDRFTLQARVASGGIFGVKGNLHWRQRPKDFDMRVAGPFGIGAISIRGDGRSVEIRSARGVFRTDDPEAAIHDRLGWSFPVEHLRYWVLGLPAPTSEAELEFDREGRLESLEQDGWELSFNEYVDDGPMALPRKFEAANDEVRIKVVVDEWSGVGGPK